MSHYYLDASALVKRYVDEVGSICEVIDLIDKRVEFPLPLCHLRPWPSASGSLRAVIRLPWISPLHCRPRQALDPRYVL